MDYNILATTMSGSVDHTVTSNGCNAQLTIPLLDKILYERVHGDLGK